MGERNRQIEPCQQTQITHRVTTDLVRSAIRNAEIAGHVVGVSAASTVGMVELGRSTVRGMSSVTQRKDDDDEDADQRGLGEEAWASPDLVSRLTRRLAKQKGADDKHVVVSVGADVGHASQLIFLVSQTTLHCVHTTTKAKHKIKAGC